MVRTGKEHFLRTYLIIVLAFGVIGISDSLLSLFNTSSIIYGVIVGILAFLFFFFNLFALVHLIQEKLEKITWILPVYHLLSAIIFTILGVLLSLKGLLTNNLIFSLGIMGILTSSFEILFSLFLLKRFKLL